VTIVLFSPIDTSMAKGKRRRKPTTTMMWMIATWKRLLSRTLIIWLEGERDNQEQLVLDAAKHVRIARAQRLLFVAKKELAWQQAHLSPQEQCSYCFVCDFAQNMYLPNFAAEQPGATYYYSPLNIIPLGIVDCSKDPSELTAMTFYESKFSSCCCFFF
jgi:hypothetical protein